jgi:NAD(P)-dependent dehydrogenase (short-subunit alcohol dehydrogenase family)
VGLYHASKWALEGFSQSLAGEVGRFGVNVTLVEPAGFATDWAGASSVQAQPMAIYDVVRAERAERFKARRAGDPQATAAAILELVDAEEPPLRLLLGEGTLDMIRAEYERRLEEWERWEQVAEAAQGGVRQ